MSKLVWWDGLRTKRRELKEKGCNFKIARVFFFLLSFSHLPTSTFIPVSTVQSNINSVQYLKKHFLKVDVS